MAQLFVSRLLVATFLAFFVTFGLFYMMQYIIASGEIILKDDEKRIRVDLGRVRKIEETMEIVRKPDEIIPEITPITDIQMTLSVSNVSNPINLSAEDVETANVNTGLGGTFIADGEYLPIVRVPPQYPARASEQGLEGFVILEFTVTKNGSTTKVQVVEASHRVFIRNAIRAGEKFKYKPKIVDGEAISVAGVRTQIDFKLEE
tara:strand:- start:70 stop:681 length:612 start_codon:yes stop_codon:yes gene_type:complete